MTLHTLYQKFLNLLPWNRPVTFSRKVLGTKTIAHAMGEWQGEIYLNCQEAFESNYAKGARFFEADFSLTSDHKIVLFHDGHEKRFGLKENFSEAEFLACRPFGATLLTAQKLASLFAKYSDAYLITDVKGANTPVLKELCELFAQQGLDPKKMIIPQLYHPDEFQEIKHMNFERYIFTVYRFKKRMRETAKFLRATPEISALTVTEKWVNKGYLELAKRCNIQVYFHSINDEKKKEEFFKRGASGIYTHRLFP